jgi:leucyl-tRNA synthetase
VDDNHKGVLENVDEVKRYIEETKKKDEIERTSDNKEKTGIELKGVKAINPINGEEIPVWIADFVLVQYGTGAVFADMHDERDYAFAKKYNLPMRRSVEPIFYSTDSPIQKDLPIIKRNAVCAVVRNPRDGKYLCSVWRDMHMNGMITGGVEEGEDMVEGARREIYEESGYKNIKLVNNPDIAIHSLFFHRKKKENRWARFQYLFFDLIDEEKDPIDEKEAAIHDVVWKTRKELENFFSVVEGEFTLGLIDNNLEYIYTGEGILTNSGPYTGMKSEEVRTKITESIGGKVVTKYKLRDWVFSRQRYWGEPIPIIHCEKCGYVPVPEKDLPIKLPKVKSYLPTDNGESPLAVISKWVNTTCPKCKGKAKRETDTMPNWAGSSWYYLRYADPKNQKEFVSKQNLKYWTPVDWYNGGMEHTTLHLLYSRFWHKFLYDLKLVPTSEPYAKRTSQGLILADDGTKFSKSKGNGVKPEDIVKLYGADTLRVYEMFMGPFDQAVPWNTQNVIGSRRFLEKVWKVGSKVIASQNSGGESILNQSFTTLLHKTIKKVTEDIESMSFNTAISSMMVLVNEMEKSELISVKDYKSFLQLLSSFAPHITEELWRELGEKKSIHLGSWPKWDEDKIIDNEFTIVIQVNGKVRSELVIPADTTEEGIKKMALENKAIIPWILNKEVKRVIYVKGRLVNIVL